MYIESKIVETFNRESIIDNFCNLKNVKFHILINHKWLSKTILGKKIIIYIYIYVGPNDLRPWPVYSLGPKARAEEGYRPGSVIRVQNGLGAQPRTI